MVVLLGLAKVAREKEKARVGEKSTTIHIQKIGGLGAPRQARTQYGNVTNVALPITTLQLRNVECASVLGSSHNGMRRPKKKPPRKTG